MTTFNAAGRGPEIESVNLADPDTYARQDLDAYWRRLRSEDPVHWHTPIGGQPGFWVVSRHADVMGVYRDNENFTSERGNVLVTLLAGGDSAAGRMLAVTDGRRHRALRSVLLKAFSPRALEGIAERVRANTRRLVAAAVRRGECDFAADVSEHIPLTTICDLLGVPEADRAYLLSRIKCALSSDTPGQSAMDAWAARSDILMYFSELVRDRGDKHGNDVISLLTQCVVEGESLSRDEISLNCYSMILGGDETSRFTMNDAVYTFTRNRDEWRKLRERRVGIDVAREEVLRWASPNRHFGRSAVNQVEIAGRQIRPGDIVTLWHSSANRDPEVFPGPDRFDLGRTPNKHIAFGYGPHACLGAHLGRVEIGVMLDTLRTLSREFELIHEPQPCYSNFLAGFSSLRVRFEPDEAGLARVDS
jgi:cytochrome P450